MAIQLDIVDDHKCIVEGSLKRMLSRVWTGRDTTAEVHVHEPYTPYVPGEEANSPVRAVYKVGIVESLGVHGNVKSISEIIYGKEDCC
jgi:hypothetical protein